MRKGRKRQKLMPMWNEGPLIPALVGPAFLFVTWNASSPFLQVCLSGSWRQTGGRTFPLLFSSVNSDGDLKCSWLENCTRRSKSENIPRLPGKSPILTTLGRSVLGHLNDFNYRKISEYKLHLQQQQTVNQASLTDGFPQHLLSGRQVSGYLESCLLSLWRE